MANRPPLQKSRENIHVAVMLANASVVTARKSPLTRKAGSPTRTANSTPTAVPARRAANHGRSTVTVVMSPTKGRPMPSGWPRVKARVDRPPTPANANWPSESCPAHPVSIDNDTATMATTSNSVHTSICDGLAARTGTRRAGTNRASMPRVDRRRAHQRRSRAAGTGAWRTPTEKDTPSAERARDSRSTMTSTVTKRKALNTPTSRFRLTDTNVSAIPSAMPLTTTTGIDRIRAAMAMTSARRSSPMDETPASSSAVRVTIGAMAICV